MSEVCGLRGLLACCLWLSVAGLGCGYGKGDPCQTNADCKSGLVCHPAASVRGTCVDPSSIKDTDNAVDSGVAGNMPSTGGNKGGSGGSSDTGDASTDAAMRDAANVDEDASAGGS